MVKFKTYNFLTYFYLKQELNTTKKVTFIETGIKYDVIPIFVTTFLLGIPLLYVLGVFYSYNKLFYITEY